MKQNFPVRLVETAQPGVVDIFAAKLHVIKFINFI